MIITTGRGGNESKLSQESGARAREPGGGYMFAGYVPLASQNSLFFGQL